MPPALQRPQPAEADVTQGLLNEWSPSQLCERARQAAIRTVGAVWAELPTLDLSNRLQQCLARGLISMHKQGSTMHHGSLASREQEVSSDMMPDSPAAVKAAVQEVERGTNEGLASWPGPDPTAHGWEHTTTVNLLRPSSAWPPHIKVVSTRRSALRWHVHYEGSIFQSPRAEQLEWCLDTCY